MPEAPEKCAEHPDGLPVAKCLVCGKTVCSECVQARGYFCSDACRDRHQQEQKPPSEAELRQKAKLEKQSRAFDVAASWLFKRVPLTIFGLIAVYVALRIADKSGDERWSATAPGATHFEAMALGKDTAYVLRDDGFCVAFNTVDGSEKWSVQLEGGQCYGGSVTLAANRVVVEANSRITVLSVEGKKLWSRTKTGFGRYDTVFGNTGILATGVGEEPAPREVAGPEDLAALMSSIRGSDTLSFLDLGTGRVMWDTGVEQRDIRKLIAGDQICIYSSCIPGTYRFVPCPKHSEEDSLAALGCDQCRYVETEDTDSRVEIFNTATGKRLWTLHRPEESIEAVFLEKGRVVVVTDKAVYCLSREGKTIWTKALPAKPVKCAVTQSGVLVIAVEGSMSGISLENGADLWQCDLSGDVVELIAGPESVYVMTAMEKIIDLEERRRKYEKTAPMAGQQKMVRKLAGIDEEEDAEHKASTVRRVLSVLAGYDAGSGRQYWIQQNIRGDVYPFEKGFMLLQYVYGLDAAVSGKIPTYVNMLSATSGKRYWKTEIDTYVRKAELADDSVVLITETAVRSLRRRGFLNRLTRF